MRGSKVAKIVGWVFAGIGIAAVLGLVLGYGLMWLWNWLMPDIFGLPEIGYWQAVGLFVLAHLLFKGHHHHGGPSDADKKHTPWKNGHPPSRFARKIHGMVEERDPEPEPTAPSE